MRMVDGRVAVDRSLTVACELADHIGQLSRRCDGRYNHQERNRIVAIGHSGRQWWPHWYCRITVALLDQQTFGNIKLIAFAFRTRPSWKEYYKEKRNLFVKIKFFTVSLWALGIFKDNYIVSCCRTANIWSRSRACQTITSTEYRTRSEFSAHPSSGASAWDRTATPRLRTRRLESPGSRSLLSKTKNHALAGSQPWDSLR